MEMKPKKPPVNLKKKNRPTRITMARVFNTKRASVSFPSEALLAPTEQWVGYWSFWWFWCLFRQVPRHLLRSCGAPSSAASARPAPPPAARLASCIPTWRRGTTRWSPEPFSRTLFRSMTVVSTQSRTSREARRISTVRTSAGNRPQDRLLAFIGNREKLELFG